MLLAIDVGNTNLVLGVSDGPELLRSWRISTDRNRTGDEYGLLFLGMLRDGGIDPRSVHGVVVSSVVPPVMREIENAVADCFHVEPLVVGPGVRTGLKIHYENQRDVGADRIVNAVAALELYGGPVIIVDFGTATTFCAVSAEGDYLGGVIAPGVGISAEALFERTARLPRVSMEDPGRVVGRSTVASIQSGLYFGAIGQISEIVKRIQEELGWSARVIATGGLAPLLAGAIEAIDEVCPDLTLVGLRLIHERNCVAEET